MNTVLKCQNILFLLFILANNCESASKAQNRFQFAPQIKPQLCKSADINCFIQSAIKYEKKNHADFDERYKTKKINYKILNLQKDILTKKQEELPILQNQILVVQEKLMDQLKKKQNLYNHEPIQIVQNVFEQQETYSQESNDEEEWFLMDYLENLLLQLENQMKGSGSNFMDHKSLA